MNKGISNWFHGKFTHEKVNRSITRVVGIICLGLVLTSANCVLIPLQQRPAENSLASCSLTETEGAQIRVRNSSLKELVLFTGGTARSRVPANAQTCYVRLENIQGSEPLPIQFYDRSDLGNGNDPSGSTVFFDGGSKVISTTLQRPYTFVIPRSQGALRSGTVMLTYNDPSYSVSVFLAPASDNPVCPALQTFSNSSNYDYITAISANSSPESVTIPYNTAYRFMFAYWQRSELSIEHCAVSSVIHTVSADNRTSSEIIVPYTPPVSSTGQITIYNDRSVPVTIRIGTVNIEDHNSITNAPTGSSTLQSGSNRTFTIRSGEYPFRAASAVTGTLIEQQQITIGGTTAIWRVNGDLTD